MRAETRRHWRRSEAGATEEVTDKISITVPTGDRFRSVPALVLGGIGSRLDLPYERMDDLQLAVLSLLESVDGDEATLDVAAEDGLLSVAVGPLRSGSAEDAALGRVVSLLVDSVVSGTRDGADWITVRVSRRAEPDGVS